MTDKSELERVREIHRMAESYLYQIEEHPWNDTARFAMAGDAVWWTREELLAWPERLEALLKCRYWADKRNTIAIYDADEPDKPDAAVGPDLHDGPLKEAISRGLCLYREMLTDEQPAAVEQVAKAWEPMVVQRTVEAIQRAQKPVDPYEQHRLAHGGEESISKAMAVVNAARARNIAALRAELDRPASILDQQHPREWFSGRRGGRRKL